MLKDFKDLLAQAKSEPARTVSVAVAQDEAVLTAVRDAAELGFIRPVLVGDGAKIEEISKKIGLSGCRVVDCPDEAEAVKTAVTLVRNHEADVLMKGLLNTAVYMRGLLNKEYGLRTGRLLSLLAVYELPFYHKLLYCSDSGINVAPNVEQKQDILTNALLAMGNLGLSNPKVALLTANEMVDPKVVSTVDAAELVARVAAGKIPPCIAEGPIAFDVAFDASAAAHKGIASQIAGDPDLLLFPNIEAGNILGKSWLQFCGAKWAGIILGAAAPAILGSRSDTPEIKINSIAMACLAAEK
ncbi:MAG: phosphate acyltransferase [Oscillospiraceae bacterium]